LQTGFKQFTIAKKAANKTACKTLCSRKRCRKRYYSYVAEKTIHNRLQNILFPEPWHYGSKHYPALGDSFKVSRKCSENYERRKRRHCYILIFDCQKTKVAGVFLAVCAIFIIREMAPFAGSSSNLMQ